MFRFAPRRSARLHRSSATPSWLPVAALVAAFAASSVGCATIDGDGDAESTAETADSLAAAVSTTCNADPALPGDTRPCTQLRYPDEAFIAAGGRVLNVKAKFGAKGDGVTDDTAAIRAAYDYVLNELYKVGWDGFFQKDNRASFVLYFPDGVYLVKESIVYSGPTRIVNGARTAEGSVQLRFIGQSREKTVLRLKERSAGFDAPASPKPVLAFGKNDFNNTPGGNSLRNMTIKVGAGNPGAVGVYFGGANQSDVQNVSIIAEDGAGVVGLDDSIGTVLSYQRDITVQGFDYGIRMVPYHFTEPAIEHATLVGQRKAGVQFVNGTGSLRMIESVNTVPAVLVSDGGSHAVVLDSTFRGGAAGDAAIKLVAGSNGLGHVFARNVTVGGYGCGVKKGASCERTGSIKGESCTANELVSDTPLRFSASRPSTLCSLNMPVKEVPSVPTETDQARWAKPAYTAADFASGRNASPAIQAAMTAGCPGACASTVYFPVHEYDLDSTVTIPCSVRRVTGLFTRLGGAASPKLRVAQGCTEPLVIEDTSFERGTAIEQTALRPLVLQRLGTQGFLYDANVPSGRPTVFMNMVGTIKSARSFSGVDAFIRVANAESTTGSFVVENDAKVWLMGFKTEKDPVQFTVRSGGQLEVMGGIMNQYCQETSNCEWASSLAIDVAGASSKASIVVATNGPSSLVEHFNTIIKETQGGVTRSWGWNNSALPDRVGRSGQVIVPLYVSY